MIANLNGYITQIQSSIFTNHHANILSITTTFYCEQMIPNPLFFMGDRSKVQAWIIDIHLKLTTNTQLFWTKQAMMIYINSCLERSIKNQI